MDTRVNILCVDDKADNLLSLEAVLSDLNENVVRARSGRDALREVLTREFAVILLDVNMPGMDGFETATLIRARQSSAKTPIIFITAANEDPLVMRGYSLGAVDYIHTPIVPEVLRTKVGVFVDLYRKTHQTRLQARRLAQRAEQLQRLAAASVAITAAPSVGRALQIMADTGRRIIECHQAGCFLLVDRHTGIPCEEVEAFTSFADQYTAWRDRPLKLDDCARALSALGRIATRLTDEQVRQSAAWTAIARADLPPGRGAMIAPILARDGQHLGVFYLSEKAESEFNEDDEAILVQLSKMGSAAIENIIFSQARETSRMEDEFLGTLSHELRTPLNAIVGWTQLLQSNSLTDEQRAHALEVIDRNAKAQAKLIEDLLDVSRITMGKLRVNLKPMQLRPIVQSAVEAMRPQAEAKAIDLRLHCDSRRDGILGDTDRLQQVMNNLLTNAIKFTPKGGRVEVALERDGDQLIVRVSDTGKGIAPEFLPFVFDRFRQSDSSHTRTQTGLGIGLTIVWHIVEGHGGTVRAMSDGEGQGAIFVIRLPAQDAATRGTPAVEDGDAAPAPNVSAQGARVLVVDDEPDARELVAEVVRGYGAEVDLAASAEIAMQLIESRSPHLIISDIAMPGTDGYALIRRIRLLPPERGGATPAMALTTYARAEDRRKALDAGFQMHITKPANPAELGVAICALLQQREGIASPLG